MLALLEGAAIGFVVGAFTPSVGRRIKAYFVKESAVVKPTLLAGVGAAEVKVAAELKKV